MVIRRLVFIILLLSNFSVNGQEKCENVIFSSFNNDSIFLMAEATKSNPDIEIRIKIVNHSNKVIFMDTTFLSPSALSDKHGEPAKGIGISHLTKNEVNEANINAISIKPSAEINLKFLMNSKQYGIDFSKVKYYWFEIKYLTTDDINEDWFKNGGLILPKIYYYFKSRRFIVGNCNLEMLITE